MTRLGSVLAVGALLLVSGCAERLVELPTDRRPAVIVKAPDPRRCPADTVAYSDDDPESGAGAVPAGFEGRIVLRCEVDYLSMRVRGGSERLTVRQWRAPLTPELRSALDLPDRELRPRVGCAESTGGDTMVYLVDAGGQSVRVLLPRDDPCSHIRKEVASLLPANGTPPDLTFTADRKAR